MMENIKLEKFGILCYFHPRGTLNDYLENPYQMKIVELLVI